MGNIRLSLLTFVIFVSCTDNVPKPLDYIWKVSDAIPYAEGIKQFKIADGKSLFISGWVRGRSGIFKLENNNWTQLAVLDGWLPNDFSVYNGVLYFGDYNGLYRVKNSTIEKFTVNDPHVNAMEVYNDKLFITGDSLLIESKYYATASFDGSSFSPVSEHNAGYSMLVANNKLFLSNYPVLQYDNNETRSLEFGGQSNITHDDSGNLYIAAIGVNSKFEFFSTVHKYSNGKSTMLGDTLKCRIEKVQAFDKTLIVIGYIDLKSKGVSYYYKNDAWKQIEISFPPGTFNIIGDMVLYNNKILGSPILASPLTAGKVFELK